MVYSALFNMLAIFMPMPNMLNMPLMLVFQLLMHVTFGQVSRKIAQKRAKRSKECPKKCSFRSPNQSDTICPLKFNLFPNKHFTGCGEVACLNRVEIDTTTHGFTGLITPIPIDGL